MRIIRFIDKETMHVIDEIFFPEWSTGHRVWIDYGDGVCGVNLANTRSRLLWRWVRKCEKWRA